MKNLQKAEAIFFIRKNKQIKYLFRSKITFNCLRSFKERIKELDNELIEAITLLRERKILLKHINQLNFKIVDQIKYDNVFYTIKKLPRNINI